MTFHQTREGWLNEAVDLLTEMFAQTKEDGEPVKLPAVKVSCGWPSGNVRKAIGECFPTKSSGDGISQLFISPTLDDPTQILATLIHELCHAVDDCESGHKGRFKKLAVQMGLEGKMTATIAGDALVELLRPVVQTLGTYPHSALNLGLTKVKKQPTRMIKVECKQLVELEEAGKESTCGYSLRTTMTWLEVGVPTCPRCHEEMEVSQADLDKLKAETS